MAKSSKTASASGRKAARRRPDRTRRQPAAAGGAAIASRNPKFEAIALTVQTMPDESSEGGARQAANAAKLEKWRLEPVSPERGQYELVPPAGARAVSPARAWDKVYTLRDRPEVVHAEPLFEYDVADVQGHPAVRVARAGDDPATANNFEWSLENANVIKAWAHFGTRIPGAGAVVGHPDTGYTPHPDLADVNRLLIDQGFDFDDDDADPIDDLSGGVLDNPGHGTGTGSVIVSGRGGAPGAKGPFVSGVAPGASLIPIRTTESVVLFSMRGLRRAIDHAVGKGVHVISMSLGGPTPSPALRDAVRRAVDAGVIVLAAAGNQVRVVVFPAAYEEVIAVAASNVRDAEWSGSCRGDAVDITAPGESVWRATVERGNPFTFSVARGNGTSFAVATTAGVAALWVSFHGFDNLVRRYGRGQIARVFKSLLQQTCRTPPGWNTGDFGPGIVDARALLAEPLPQLAPARKLRDAQRPTAAMDATGVETFVHLMPDLPRTQIVQGLAALLKVNDRDLPKALQDVGDELAFQVAMRAELKNAIAAAGRPAGRGAARVRATTVMPPGESSTRLRSWLGAGAGGPMTRARGRKRTG